MEETNFLDKALKIKKWVENSKNKMPPSKKSKDEEEKKLAKELTFIRKKLIKPYQKLKKEKQIQAFEEKYPNIYEIVQTVQAIDKYSIIQGIEEKELLNVNEQLGNEFQNLKSTETPEFDYNKEDKKQTDLVNLILKDIKIRNQMEEASKMKQKYENS